MLFAAGFGTRMGALTRNRPKPLIEVAGTALLDHALQLCIDQGVSHKVVNAHYHADQIQAHLDSSDVSVTVERPTILDTGGGLRAALPLLGEGPVFTLNTDAVWTGPNPLATLRAAWRPDDMDALLLLIPAARAEGHGGTGDFRCDAKGRLERGGPLTYTGAQIIKTDLLPEISEDCFSLNVLWNQIKTTDRLYGIVHTGGWCDVGHPAGIDAAEAMLGRNAETFLP